MKAKTKLTKLCSILLVLVMVVGMLPTVALAEEVTTPTTPTTTGTTSETTTTTTPETTTPETTTPVPALATASAPAPASTPATEKADFSADPTAALTLLNAAKTGTEDSTWDPDTNTLTLNGVNFTTTASTAVKLPDDAKIVVNGDNTIKGGDAATGDCYGIYGAGRLTIQGTGTLNVTSGTAGNLSFGIHAQNSVTINSGAVTATGGAAPNNQSFGIRALYNDLTIEGGNVKAKGGEARVSSNGLWAGNGNVVIRGGEVEAESGRVMGVGASSGIYAKNVGINNTGTIVTATGGTAQHGTSYGINAVSGGTVTFSGGTLTAATKGDSCINGTFNAAGKTISFDSNDGVGNMMARTTATEYTLPANGFTPPAGKQLKGWSVNGTEKAVGDKITVTDGTTVKAVWENITYTVSFDANGGTGMMADVSGVSGTYNLPANGFTAPAGKRFKCWSVNSAEKAVGDKITVSANTTVKAVWETIVTAVWETIPATSTEYDILDGANSSWTQNSDGSLSIRGSGAFSEFVGVKVDGKSVDEQYYTVKEGSTIVTLKAEYLSTLAAGPHTIQLIWKDGTASTTFNINVNNPNTGDNGGLALAAALLALSAAAIAASGFNRKRGKSSR